MIEFYVSQDEKHVGISISGLGRLCGITRQSISNLLNTPEDKPLPKWLEPFTGKLFTPQVTGVNGAKIIDIKAASRIIRYYAYESPNTNEIAKNAYDKFAEIGMDKWVKELTGFSEANNLTELTSLIHQLMGKFDKLEATTSKYNAIKQTTVSLYPGIDYINSDIETGHLLESPKEDEPFTAMEWLKSKGITLDNSHKHKFALLVGQTYVSLTQKEPRKIKRKDKRGNATQRRGGRR